MPRNRQNKKVVVIGGGLGGLSAAITCATEGFDVALYEKNDKLGGKLNVKEVDGYSFDLGPSIIILPQYFRRIFARAGKRMEDYVELMELQPQWRSFFEDGTVIDLHPDMARMERELERLGANADGYFEFLAHSRRLCRFAETAYFERGADTVGEILRGFGPLEITRGTDPLRTMHAGVRRFVTEPHLGHMLDFFIKYVGSSPYDSPGLMNLLPFAQLGYGLYYVKGGMYNLARAYARLMEELGIEVHTGAEVVEIIKDTRADKGVTGVSLKGGGHVPADVVISNMEVIPAYERLLGEGGLMMRRYKYMFEPAASGLVVHLGLDREFPQLEHHNFFFSADPEKFLDQIHRKKQLPDDPTIYLVCPTRTNKDLAPKGHEIIKILPHIPHLQDNRFTMAEYAALKERVFDKLERMGVRGLRRHIQVEDVLVPDDLERMYYSNRGAIYGVVADRKRNFALKAPKQSEKYKNLFFVGGSVNPGGGTCMVVLSGQQAGMMVAQQFAN